MVMNICTVLRIRLSYLRSILEDEEERGVAHIVEHLAFSATRKHTNHDIIRFLESIGAEFGACQNASTSADETIYELMVPIDKPDILSQALNILAEFSTEVSSFIILSLTSWKLLGVSRGRLGQHLVYACFLLLVSLQIHCAIVKISARRKTIVLGIVKLSGYAAH